MTVPEEIQEILNGIFVMAAVVVAQWGLLTVGMVAA